ncbi:hypothetical protein HA402_005303 [Bradysia odoriphaga]|nr:hypothetical protein HA402_005303 [Bradysia odoriphaga]
MDGNLQNNSITEYYDLTKDSKSPMKKMRLQKEETYGRRNQRASSQSKHESRIEKKFRKRLQSVISSVKWTEFKEKKKYSRRSSSEKSEDEDRDYRRRGKNRKSSSSKYYRSRSRSPSRRDMDREYYRRRSERRDSVARYRRSHSDEERDEHTVRPSASRGRRMDSRRSCSYERDFKYSRQSKTHKYSNEQVVKTEISQRFSEEAKDTNENDSHWCTEPESVPESRVATSVFDQLRKKIQSTLQSSSHRNQSVTHSGRDSTSHHDVHEWQDSFDLDSEPLSESTRGQIDEQPEIQRENVTDNLKILENDSNKLAMDVKRQKIKFTFTKSMKTDTQVSSVFNESSTDNLTDARSKLSDLLRSALNNRDDQDNGDAAVSEQPPVQEHSAIDEDSIDQEIIQKIVSQTQVHTSSSYELSVDVPVGFDSVAAVSLLENKLSSESQRYSGTTTVNSSATQLVCNKQYSPRDGQPFTETPIVNATTTQVVRSNYSSLLTTRFNLPVPSTKFLPVVPFRSGAFHRENPFEHNPFKSEFDSSDLTSHHQSMYHVETKNSPLTYGEHKNRIASRESLGNYKIPKKTTKINCSTASVSKMSVVEDFDNFDRPMSAKWNEKGDTQDKIKDKKPTAKNAASNPVTNASNKENARKVLANFKIPKTNRSSANVSNKSVVEPIKPSKKNNKSRAKRNTPFIKSQSHGPKEPMNAIKNGYNSSDNHMRSITISSSSSVDESSPNGTPETIGNDDWDSYDRPISPPSNVDANVQADKNSTENGTTTDPAANVPKQENPMEALKGWMQTNEFATLVDLMQQLAQHKNLEKLKDALTNKNDCPRNVEHGEGSSTATLAVTTTVESNGNSSSRNESIPKFKNIDTAWHSLRKVLECQECEKPVGNSLVSHYVNQHPNCEIITSRLAPEVAERLRSGIYESNIVISKPENSSSYHYKQFCYFCNVYRRYHKLFWINHMARHTGYYGLKCNHCSRKFACGPLKTKCVSKGNYEAIPQPQFKNRHLLAYVCDICNFVRFHQHEIEMHLTNEHGEMKDSKKFKEMTFLSFPDAEGKYERKKPTKKYKKRKPKLVDEFLANLTDGDDDLKEEIDSEYEFDSFIEDSESEEDSDWSKMDIQDDEGEYSFSETSSDSDFT